MIISFLVVRISCFTVVFVEWELVFKGSKGIRQSIYDFWTNDRYSAKPATGARLLDDSCGCHYKSPLVERWNTLNIKKVGII